MNDAEKKNNVKIGKMIIVENCTSCFLHRKLKYDGTDSRWYCGDVCIGTMDNKILCLDELSDDELERGDHLHAPSESISSYGNIPDWCPLKINIVLKSQQIGDGIIY